MFLLMGENCALCLPRLFIALFKHSFEKDPGEKKGPNNEQKP